MKRWALLALLGPLTAHAGPFTSTDAGAGGVEIDLTYSWTLPDSSVFGPAPVTFTFANPTAFSPPQGPCSRPGTEEYCFDGTYSTDNSGFGTFTSRVVVDQESCVYGSDLSFGEFRTALATCDLVQEIEATFGNTTVTYTFVADVLGIQYQALFSEFFGERRRRGQNPNIPAVNILPAVAATSFGTGSMIGNNGVVLVNGSYTEVSP